MHIGQHGHVTQHVALAQKREVIPVQELQNRGPVPDQTHVVLGVTGVAVMPHVVVEQVQDTAPIVVAILKVKVVPTIIVVEAVQLLGVLGPIAALPVTELKPDALSVAVLYSTLSLKHVIFVLCITSQVQQHRQTVRILVFYSLART